MRKKNWVVGICGIVTIIAAVVDYYLQNSGFWWHVAIIISGICIASSSANLARLLFYTDFERVFRTEGSTLDEDQGEDERDIIQQLVNERIHAKALGLAHVYNIEVELRRKTATLSGEEALQKHKLEMAETKARVARAKKNFYNARIIAAKYGYRTFESFKPYQVDKLVDMFLHRGGIQPLPASDGGYQPFTIKEINYQFRGQESHLTSAEWAKIN